MTQAAKLAQLGSPGISTGFKNRIINGAMMVHQRGGTITATGTDNVYGVDRWQMRTTSGSTVVSMQQSSTAPAGFINSFLLTVTTADASLGSADICCLVQKIEGLNVQDLGWGTADAKAVTLSFWVRSSVTGTYGAGVQNSGGSRSYPSSFVINTANTYEYKTITIPGDTTGTWLTTNGVGIYLWFSLSSGSNTLGTANSWAAADYRGTTGQVNWGETLSNTFYITGVQLEVGTTATDFEYRDYGRELQMCQRYYYLAASGASKPLSLGSYSGTNYVEGYIVFKASMRANPTLVTASGTNYYGIYRAGAEDAFDSFTLDSALNTETAIIFNNGQVSGTAGQVGNMYTKNASSLIAFNAEL